MKVSVSLPDDDVDFLDSYAVTHGLASRSAAVHTAVRLLEASQLAGDYAAAWDEWAAGEDASDWDGTAGDGLTP